MAANTAKQNDWIKRLQTKASSLREDRKTWTREAVELRGDITEAKVTGFPIPC